MALPVVAVQDATKSFNFLLGKTSQHPDFQANIAHRNTSYQGIAACEFYEAAKHRKSRLTSPAKLSPSIDSATVAGTSPVAAKSIPDIIAKRGSWKMKNEE